MSVSKTKAPLQTTDREGRRGVGVRNNLITYNDCLSYLSSLIETKTVRHMGAYGLERMKQLLEKLGNPQENYPVIHVAGTSGKWSTATICSHLLVVHGYKTGLHVSPHLIDFRERIQINNHYIDTKTFITVCQIVLPFVESMKDSVWWMPSYYEASMAIVLLCFEFWAVDVAVIEVWCGGLYDGSNCIQRSDKISIINALGYDHTDLLGHTIEEICLQKAWIILPHSHCISLLHSQTSCRDIISDIASRKQADIIRVDPNDSFSYDISLIGDHQKTNAHLAYKAVELFLSRDDKTIDQAIVQQTLQTIQLPGRCHHVQIQEKNLLLDGAHNEQKMTSLIQTLQKHFPNRKYHFYLAFKQGKDRQKMIDILSPDASSITIGSFSWIQDTAFQSVDPQDIYDYITQNHHTRKATIINNPSTFQTDHLAWYSENDIIVCTWSLYRLADLYKARKIT